MRKQFVTAFLMSVSMLSVTAVTPAVSPAAATAAAPSETAKAPLRLPCSAVQAGLSITASGHSLTVEPGIVYVNDKKVAIATPQVVALPSTSAGTIQLATLYVSEAGKLGFVLGTAAARAPEAAPAPADSVALAHILLKTSPLSNDDIMPITRSSADVQFANRARNVRCLEKTLAKLKANQPVRILFWGDSVTHGANASAPEFQFTALVEKGLKEHFKNDYIVSKNIGIGGTNIVQRVGKLEQEMTSFSPDLVVIEFVNDTALKEPQVEEAYKKAHDILDSDSLEVIYMDPFLPTPAVYGIKPTVNPTDAFLVVAKQPYFGFVRRKCQEYNWALADCARRWEQLTLEGLRADLLLEDGIIHPNNTGHQLLSEEVLKCFR